VSQSLERGMAILDLVAERPLTILEIGQALDVHPTTALRLLQSLRKGRLVHLQEDGSYGLGSALIDLGRRALESSDIRSRCRPLLEALGETTTETVHMAVLEGLDIVYVDKVESRHAVRIESRIGRIVVKHATGVGKAILAMLPESDLVAQLHTIDFTRFTANTITEAAVFRAQLAVSRERGYAVDDEEHEAEICCVAVPFFAAGGAVAGSISVTAPSSRMPIPRILEFLPDMTQTASTISEALGYRERGVA
jgi:DNA-binding IclR family transcriptional regulator